jgi:PAS domain S-box-containing protein
MDSINNKEKAGEQADLALLQRRIEILEKEKQELQTELGLLGRAEQELAAHKKEFGTLLDHLLAVVARYDRELRCLYINAAAKRALGLEIDFFIGRTIHQLGMPAEQVALWDKTIRQVFESAQPQIMEFELPTLKGLRYYRTDVVPEFALETSPKNNNGYDFNSSRETVSSVLCISHDITELKQTEEKLRLKERQYRTLVELSPDTISLYDRELRHVYISPAVERKTGLPPEFFLGKNAEELGMPIEARERWEAVGRKVFETGQPQILEFKSWLGNQERFSQVLFSPELAEDGKTVEFILGINRDVTEVKLAQRALEERERQYRTLIENSPDIITRYDENLRVTFVNSTVESSTGRPSQFYVGKTLYELGIAEQQISSIKQVFASGEPQRLEYSAAIPGSGEFRYFQARIIPEFDGPGENEDRPASPEAHRITPGGHINPEKDNTKHRKVQSVITITTDITALKYSELALATQKERLDITLRSIAEGVIATDPQGRITVFNTRAETLTGWPLEKALGQPFEKVVRLFDEGQQAFLDNLVQQVLEKREMVKLGSAIAKPVALLPYSANSDLPQDGQDVPESVHLENNPATAARKLIEGRASPLYEGAKSQNGPLGMVFIFEDVTQRRRMEEELQKADKIQAVGVLAAGIAHDFNNFLAAILGNLAFIRRNLSATNTLSKNLVEAENACLSARSLTQQLLTFAQGGAPVKKTIAMGELLEETASFILRGTSTRCQVEVASDLWPAELDAGQISQVIYNLVLNAQQAMPEGGIVKVRAKNVLFSDEAGETGNGSTLKNLDKAQTEPDLDLLDLKEATVIQETLPVKPGSYIQLEIQDEGIGIPAKYLSRIFDPYFTTKQKGNGLGLSVCYSIVKNHEGYITNGASYRLTKGKTEQLPIFRQPFQLNS